MVRAGLPRRSAEYSAEGAEVSRQEKHWGGTNYVLSLDKPLSMNDIIHSITQLGFLPGSQKTISLINNSNERLPDRIPFYLQKNGSRLKRIRQYPEAWSGQFFRWPFNPGEGKIDPEEVNLKSETEKPLFKGWLEKKTTRWGDVWQGDFSDYEKEGIYQVETEYGITVPFGISGKIYERVLRSYLIYIHAQRSGFEIPGVRAAEHLDDGVRDDNGEQISAVGGWYDAGDLRKWLTLTSGNLESLRDIARSGIRAFEEQAIDEMKWGNRFFHSMIDQDGQVFEDVGGGTFKDGLDVEKDWWFENHPGCNCDNSGNVTTDNQSGSGDERLVRTHYNPFVQFQFAYYQAMMANYFQDEYGNTCGKLAARAWKYGLKHGDDDRTLFLSARLLAATELHQADPELVSGDEVLELADRLLERQNSDTEGISGFFEEMDGEGFRSFAFSTFPPKAVLAAYKVFSKQPAAEKLKDSLTSYIDNYLVADAQSNPFSMVPYGVFRNPGFRDHQVFRDGGRNKYLRTFIHPFNSQEIMHPTNSVFTAHARLLKECADLFSRPDWETLAEQQVEWGMGHNTTGLSLFTGIGHRHPVPYSSVHVQIPEAALAGFIGTPEDVPYLETSNWIEWSTQEIWDVHFYEVAGMAALVVGG